MFAGLHIAKVAPSGTVGDTGSSDTGPWDRGGLRDLTPHISYHLELLAACRTESVPPRARRGQSANRTKAGR